MATRADSDAETNVGGHQLGCWRRCGALVADTAIHKTLYGTAAATGHEAEPIKSRLVQRPIAGCRTLARPTGDHSRGMRAAFPRGAPDRAVDPGCARLCHAETLVRPPLTWGMHGHRRNAWPLCLRPSHLRRTQWPPTTIATTTAAVWWRQDFGVNVQRA